MARTIDAAAPNFNVIPAREKRAGDMQDQRVWKTRLSVIGFAVGRTIPLNNGGWNCLVFVLFDLISLGPQLGGHDSQALGSGEVETLTRDTNAIVRLASEKIGSQGRHGNAPFQPRQPF
jgi:hypothetical protein